MSEGEPTLHQPSMPLFCFNSLSSKDDTDDFDFIEDDDETTQNLSERLKPESLLSKEEQQKFILEIRHDDDEFKGTGPSPLSGIVKQAVTKKRKQEKTESKSEILPEALPSFKIRKQIEKNQSPFLENDVRERLATLKVQWEMKIESLKDENYVCFPGWLCDKMKQLVGKSSQEWIFEFHTGCIIFWSRIGEASFDVDNEVNVQISVDVQGLEFYSPSCAYSCFVVKHQTMTKIFSSPWQSGGVILQFKKHGLEPLYKLKLPQDQKDLQPWSQCEPKQYVPLLAEEFKDGWKRHQFRLIPNLQLTITNYLKEANSSSKDFDRASMEIDDLIPCNMNLITDLNLFENKFIHSKIPDIRSFIVNHLVNDWTPSLVSFWKHNLNLISKSFDGAQLATTSIFVVVEKTFNHHSTILIFPNECGKPTCAIFPSKIDKHKDVVKNVLSKGRDANMLETCVMIEEWFQSHDLNAVAVKLGFVHLHSAIDRFAINEAPEILFSPFIIPEKQTKHVFFNWANSHGISLHVSIPKQERT